MLAGSILADCLLKYVFTITASFRRAAGLGNSASDYLQHHRGIVLIVLYIFPANL